MRTALWLSGFCLALCPLAVDAQGKTTPKDAVVVFKDGFYVKGKITQNTDSFVDPFSGVTLTVPKGNIYVDDWVRRINFSSGQLLEVIPLEKEQVKQNVALLMQGPVRKGEGPLPGSTFEFPKDGWGWSDKWDRVIQITPPAGAGTKYDAVQRITHLTAYSLHGLTVGHSWYFHHLIKEFPPDKIRDLVEKWLAKHQPTFNDAQKRLFVANFMRQAGWLQEADKELELIAKKHPEHKDKVKEYRDQLQKQFAETYGDDLDRLYKAGLHDAAQTLLEGLSKDEELLKLMTDKHRLLLQDLKIKYETLNRQVEQAGQYLKDFPSGVADRKAWTDACKAIADDLNVDSVERLKTFVGFAQQHASELKEGKKPTQKTEEMLALAVTGWLLGDNAAEPDPKLALKLLRTRDFLLQFLRTDSAVERAQLLASFRKGYDLPLDVVVRLVRTLPPVDPYKGSRDATAPVRLAIEVPESDGGNYLVELPPEYHPGRAYPVLVLLHSHREKPEALMSRWQEARHNGFIVAAPLWGGKGTGQTYGYSRGEQNVVLDTIRDLRRRFSVDSDRVFLYGWEQGANAAWDIGLAHPDQFAGVLPVGGSVTGFPQRYWSNAQYLPFYIVEGDRNGTNPKNSRAIFNDWMRCQYPALYIEYKGRASDWFGGEVANMTEWISRKRRYHPVKELGRYHSGGTGGEEFKTMRACDNRFYWLSTDDISSKHINSYHSWSKNAFPAHMTASISVGNQAEGKTGAKIWTQINIRSVGINQVTLWLEPNQIDFANPVTLFWNGRSYKQRTIEPSVQTLLEELYISGDRQRLFVAKVDLRN